ncbi:MAG: hypothetical protein WCP22_07935 [Chlamydiota bacterium]
MYCTVEDLKGEGVAIAAAKGEKERVERLISFACSILDDRTGQWFEERTFTAEAPMLIDGDGSNALDFSVPIISIDEIWVDGDATDADDYVVYNRILPDDRKWPRVVLEHGFVWTRGRQNIEVAGKFGYMDRDPISGALMTPEPIRQAAMRLVMIEVPKLGTGSGQLERKLSNVKSETTDTHSYTLADIAVSDGPTGDSFIDKVIERYQGPLAAVVVGGSHDRCGFRSWA